MKHFVGFFTIALFFLWLLPLGIFIKPAQEKIACGGKRAICLCSHKPQEGKPAHAAEAQTSYQSGIAQVHELASGVAHAFESVSLQLNVISKSSALNPYRFDYSFRKISRIEHVPKFA